MIEDKVTVLFKQLNARKISILSRLSELTQIEIKIMRLKWLDGLTDKEICDEVGLSQTTLYRKRRCAHKKILNALDLYGLKDMNDLSIETILDYNGHFYEAQDMLVKFFIEHSDDEKKQIWLLSRMKKLLVNTR